MLIKFKNKIILYIRNNSRLEKINYIGYTIINYSFINWRDKMDYKKAFYSKLEDCYLGAKIKQANKDKSVNKSGFTNLLDIKEKYFNYVN